MKPYNRLFSSFVYLEDNCYHFITLPYTRLLFNGGHYATITRWSRPEQSYADEFRKWLREVMDYGFSLQQGWELMAQL